MQLFFLFGSMQLDQQLYKACGGNPRHEHSMSSVLCKHCLVFCYICTHVHTRTAVYQEPYRAKVYLFFWWAFILVHMHTRMVCQAVSGYRTCMCTNLYVFVSAQFSSAKHVIIASSAMME